MKKFRELYIVLGYLGAKLKNEQGKILTINRLNRITRLLNLIVMVLSTIAILKNNKEL